MCVRLQIDLLPRSLEAGGAPARGACEEMSDMGLFRRLSALFRSWMNSLVGRMEDPSRMLETSLADMDTQLSQAATEVGRVVAEQRRLEKALEKAQAESRAWEQKAMLAVQKGNDELARACLAKKATLDAQVALLAPQAAGQREVAEQMKAQVQKLRARVDEARGKKTILMARQAQAEAGKLVYASLETLDAKDASSALGKLEAKVMQAEAHAEAQGELGVDLDLERQLAALTVEPATDDALAALRAKMGLHATAPSPAAHTIEHDEEVEQEASLFVVATA